MSGDGPQARGRGAFALLSAPPPASAPRAAAATATTTTTTTTTHSATTTAATAAAGTIAAARTAPAGSSKPNAPFALLGAPPLASKNMLAAGAGAAVPRPSGRSAGPGAATTTVTTTPFSLLSNPPASASAPAAAPAAAAEATTAVPSPPIKIRQSHQGGSAGGPAGGHSSDFGKGAGTIIGLGLGGVTAGLASHADVAGKGKLLHKVTCAKGPTKSPFSTLFGAPPPSEVKSVRGPAAAAAPAPSAPAAATGSALPVPSPGAGSGSVDSRAGDLKRTRPAAPGAAAPTAWGGSRSRAVVSYDDDILGGGGSGAERPGAGDRGDAAAAVWQHPSKRRRHDPPSTPSGTGAVAPTARQHGNGSTGERGPPLSAAEPSLGLVHPSWSRKAGVGGAPQAKRATQQAPPTGYVCVKCNVPGHYHQDCPRKPDKGQRKGKGGGEGEGGQRTPPVGYVCKICRVPGHLRLPAQAGQGPGQGPGRGGAPHPTRIRL